MISNLLRSATNWVAAGAGLVLVGALGLSLAARADVPNATAGVSGASGPNQAAGVQMSAPLAPAEVTNYKCHITVPSGAVLPPAPPACDVTRAQAISGPNQLSLNNHGGPVVTNTTQQFIFLNCLIDNNHCNSDVGNPWGNGGFLNDLFNSPFLHVTDQYTGQITNGRYLTNTSFYTWVSASVNHVMHDSDVHNLILFAINSVLNPSGGGGGYNQMYSFMLMPGQDLCFDNSTSCYCPDANCNGGTFVFCAYHGSFDAVDKTGTTIHIIYQAMPYQDVPGCSITNGPNGALIDSTNNVLSHEIFETITDPDLNAWWQSSDGQEIGDLCNFNEQNPIELNTRRYSIQKEWSNAYQNQSNPPPNACVGYTPLVTTHDFNLDEASDIAWRDASGNNAVWLMNKAAIVGAGGVGAVSTNWSIVGQRDFYGNGRHGWLWRDSVSGTVAGWLLNGLSVWSTFSLGAVPTNWVIVGTADFDGDGHGDILWRDTTTGTVVVWLTDCCPMGIKASAGLGAVPSNWIIAGTGDFNGDGKADILWRDTASGTVAIWFLNGASVIGSASVGVVPTSWAIVGTGDFNADQKSDVLWRDSTSGTVAIWEMNGASILASAAVGAVPSNWFIVDTGDYNYDAKSDILWRDTAGDIAMWFMNGITIQSTAPVGNVSTVWTIQGQNVD
jgi:FG-GAP-like repeat